METLLDGHAPKTARGTGAFGYVSSKECQQPTQKMEVISTRWAPPVIRWFLNPINYSYRYHKHFVVVYRSILGSTFCFIAAKQLFEACGDEYGTSYGYAMWEDMEGHCDRLVYISLYHSPIKL
jgi:hypothetical protein